MFPAIEHGGYIITAFVIFFLAITALIGWVVIDHRSLDRIEGDLKARGLKRRSAASPGADAQ
ncbi:MAG: heme exporter protein CcmD [Hyphomicrobiales bacterium]|nr:heme exporter protein CcmD [Hyphomicrobiales bacterium]